MDSIDYYERYAGVYYEHTVDLNMKEILDKFLERMPENAEVLDLGCGSGRDSIAMEEAGCYVTLLDGAEEMCRLAEIHTGKEVLHMTFEEMDFKQVFDGIWACASLLHVAGNKMDFIMAKVIRALKPGGVLYASFQKGAGEEIRGGRLFRDYTEETLRDTLERQTGVRILELWETADASGLEKEWLNVLVQKWDYGLEEERYEQDEKY